MRNRRSVFFTDGSRRIAFLHKSDSSTTIAIYDSQNGQAIESIISLLAPRDNAQLAVSGDGRLIAYLNGNMIHVFKGTRNICNISHNSSSLGPVHSIQFINNHLCRIHNEEIYMWSIDNLEDNGARSPRRILLDSYSLMGQISYVCAMGATSYLVGTSGGRVITVSNNGEIISNSTVFGGEQTPITKIAPLHTDKTSQYIVTSIDGQALTFNHGVRTSVDKRLKTTLQSAVNCFISSKRKIFGFSYSNGDVEGFDIDSGEIKFHLPSVGIVDTFGLSSGKLVMVQECGKVLWYDLVKNVISGEIALIKARNFKIIKTGEKESLIECMVCGNLIWINTINGDPSTVVACEPCKETVLVSNAARNQATMEVTNFVYGSKIGTYLDRYGDVDRDFYDD